MISFESDYNNGACPEILKRLTETNDAVETGYLDDEFCVSAVRRIAEACGDEKAQVYLTVGGTQANALVVGAVLRNYEGVMAAQTGHISLHEGGAIEFTGHKVIEVPQKLGKVIPEDVETYLKVFYADENADKMVYPGMLYISHPTEYGTLYTKDELTRLSGICHRYGMQLYLDGARLAYGLAADGTDVTLQDIYRLTDIFYIGGTKVGALCGEAIVFTKQNMPTHFKTVAKQRGALIAKGRLLGVQFEALFTDNTYYRLGRHAVEMAHRVRSLFTDRGYRMFLDSPTNQQFVILDNAKLEELRPKVGFSFWERYDDTHTVVRFATSWATKQSDVDYLASIL